MEHMKLQFGCLIILLYVAFVYFREVKRYHYKTNQSFFDELLIIGITSIVFDGMTAYTVNHIDMVPSVLNRLLHTLFLISIDSVIFFLCLYMLYITGSYPKKKSGRIILFTPFVINILVVILNIDSLEYIEGNVTIYSKGTSAYTCFIMVIIYMILSIIIVIKRWNYIETHKRISILTYLWVMIIIMLIQISFPETLITSIGVTVSVLGAYMNLEDPSIRKLSQYHDETVMAFATLIESRDNNTGGHVKRTSMYVKLIAEELRRNDKYQDILTKDYVANLIKAAPMHDIGKISVPDAILQKPGKLTDEEFAIMKQHSPNGGKIIQETFKNLGSDDYCEMAYLVARHHHEKWNGKGYPDGLKETEIPLCARIMAVADVFDAVSEKRCYRDAMPLDQCFAIIEDGRGQDFDPDIVDTFMNIRDKIKKAHRECTI